MKLIYKHEGLLFILAFVISTIAWLTLIIGTVGLALIYILIFVIIGLFAHARFISHIRGNGVQVLPDQFPEIYNKLSYCCSKLNISEPPETYILRTDFFNALATKFLGKNYLVLFTDVLDALEDNEDALNFYIGHELGHIKRKHIRWSGYLLPALILPLLGFAYRRAQEYTCDLHGAECCLDNKSSLDAIAAISAGDTKWKKINHTAFLHQAEDTRGFWMSLSELTSDYPWLSKRALAINAYNNSEKNIAPKRSAFAWIFALFVPRLGLGGGAGLIVLVAIIGILAAIAIPQYQTFIVRSQINQSYKQVIEVSKEYDNYVLTKRNFPNDLQYLGYSSSIITLKPSGHKLSLDRHGFIKVTTKGEGNEPGYFGLKRVKRDDPSTWSCKSHNIKKNHLPKDCRE